MKQTPEPFIAEIGMPQEFQTLIANYSCKHSSFFANTLREYAYFNNHLKKF